MQTWPPPDASSAFAPTQSHPSASASKVGQASNGLNHSLLQQDGTRTSKAGGADSSGTDAPSAGLSSSVQDHLELLHSRLPAYIEVGFWEKRVCNWHCRVAGRVNAFVHSGVTEWLLAGRMAALVQVKMDRHLLA